MNEQRLFPLALWLVNAERERELRFAAQARRVPRAPRTPIRQTVGQFLVRFGQRLAGEATLKPIRSR